MKNLKLTNSKLLIVSFYSPLFEPEEFHLVTIVRFDVRGKLVPHLVFDYVITTHQFFPS
jgi:hypothetical protein